MAGDVTRMNGDIWNATRWNDKILHRTKSQGSAEIIQSVPGIKVTTSEFNSRADSESKTSYTHGSNSQRFRSYEFLKFLKIRKERGAMCIY
jgi:hypothetical protein